MTPVARAAATAVGGRHRRFLFVYADAGAEADGVRDHALALKRELSAEFDVQTLALNWRTTGIRTTYAKLKSGLRPGYDLVVVHYSQLAWSRRGLPFGFAALVVRCRLAAPVALWVHDPDRVGGQRLKHKIASWVKGAVLQALARISAATIATVPSTQIYWARGRLLERIATAPSPSNVGGAQQQPPGDMFTIATFGIDIGSRVRGEGIVRVAEELRSSLPELRVRLLGSRSNDMTSRWTETELRKIGVQVDAPGYLPAALLADRLAASHVFLSAREGLSTRSGAIAAALACGLPVVGVAGNETTEPLISAGVLIARPHAWAEIAFKLLLLSSDSELQRELSERSRRVSSENYSWAAVARVFLNAVLQLELS